MESIIFQKLQRDINFFDQIFHKDTDHFAYRSVQMTLTKDSVTFCLRYPVIQGYYNLYDEVLEKVSNSGIEAVICDITSTPCYITTPYLLTDTCSLLNYRSIENILCRYAYEINSAGYLHYLDEISKLLVSVNSSEYEKQYQNFYLKYMKM